MKVEPKIQNDDLHLCSFMLYHCHGGRKNGEILKNNSWAQPFGDKGLSLFMTRVTGGAWSVNCDIFEMHTPNTIC